MLCRPFGASLDEFRKRGILTFDGNRAELVAILTTSALPVRALRIAQKSATDRSCGNIASIFHFSPFTFHLSAFHFSLYCLSLFVCPPTRRRQSADAASADGGQTYRQTALCRLSDGGLQTLRRRTTDRVNGALPTPRRRTKMK